MLDSIQTKAPSESAPAHPDNFWSDLGSGFMSGAAQSMTDGKGHLIRDGATTLVGLAAGHWGDVYATFGSKAPLIIGTAVVATALSRYFDDKDMAAGGNSDFDFGKSLGRFTTDVVAATGIGYLAGRQVWRKEGEDHAEYLISRDSEARYVPAHKSSYGPKQYSFATRYDHTGLTLKEKTKDLQSFLKDRGQMSEFPDLLKRMKELHNPSMEGRSWSTKF